MQKEIDFEIFFRQQKVNVCSLQQNDIILPLTHVCHNNDNVSMYAMATFNLGVGVVDRHRHTHTHV